MKPGRRHALIAALLSASVLAAAGCGSDDPSTTNAEPGVSASGCEDVTSPEAREDGALSAPTERLDPQNTYTLVFDTTCGSFTVTLDQAGAPQTAASLVSLARGGFFDNTIFHRIVPGFVIQGGDPTQTGAGGPGYSTVDPPAADAAYVLGVVAMAKTGAEPAGTAGSQFFVVTGADVGLPPDYAIVGTVTAGLDVVQAIGNEGDPNTELPLRPIVVKTVTVDDGT